MPSVMGGSRSIRRPDRLRLLASVALGCVALIVALLLAASRPAPAQAKSSYLAAFVGAYPAAAGSQLESCMLCHTASLPSLNGYGADYERLGHHFAAVESLDSDIARSAMRKCRLALARTACDPPPTGRMAHLSAVNPPLAAPGARCS